MPERLGKSPGDLPRFSTVQRPASRGSIIFSRDREQLRAQPVMLMFKAVEKRPGPTPARAMPPRLTPGPVFLLSKIWCGTDLASDGFAFEFVQ
jgi:hypothetical protein